MASTICMAATPVVGSSFEFFSLRAIVFFPTHPHLVHSIPTPGLCRSDIGSFSSAGGLPRLLAVRLGGRCPVLDRPKHLSTCLLVPTV